MLYVERNGKTWAVRFEYEGTTSIAWLVEIQKETGIVYTGVLGIATLDSRDQFTKRKGRIVALTHLLNALSSEEFLAEALPEFLPPFTKEDRASIWTEYFEVSPRRKK